MSEDAVLESLVARGAPLWAARSRETLSLEETILQAVAMSHRKAALLRILPIVLAKNARALDRSTLTVEARRRGLGAELGMLAELTARLSGDAIFDGIAGDLRPDIAPDVRFYFEPPNAFAQRLAELRTPDWARRWGFLMNVGEDSFRSAFERHVG